MRSPQCSEGLQIIVEGHGSQQGERVSWMRFNEQREPQPIPPTQPNSGHLNRELNLLPTQPPLLPDLLYTSQESVNHEFMMKGMAKKKQVSGEGSVGGREKMV